MKKTIKKLQKSILSVGASGKHLRIVAAVIIMTLLCGTVMESTAAPLTSQKTTQTSNMEVHFIDVGQGDCTLVKCGDSAMLIDTGDDTKGTAVQNYLQKQGITKLDYLILTHPDADHIGAAPVIITKFQINTVFISNFEKDNNTYRKLIQALDDKRLTYSTPKVGSSYTLGNAQFTILAPNGVYEDPNNASIALLLQNGDNHFLFTGDAEEEAENDILDNGISISADVYKVGHHGSKSSSSQAFLDMVKPAWAVISCAEGNSYGHPHAQTLNTLRSMGVKVFRTDEQGSIIAQSDGKEITWNCAPSETWKAGEPTGSSTGSASSSGSSAGTASAAGSSSTDTTSSSANSQAASASNDAAQVQNVEPPASQPDYNSVEVHITKTGKKYHSAGCQYLSKSDIVVTLEQAKAKGLGPCSKCNPPQ